MSCERLCPVCRLHRVSKRRMLSCTVKRLLTLLLLYCLSLSAPAWQQVNERAPEPAREFRAAWVATVFNIDWPTRSGLPAGRQKEELLTILDKASQMRLNAIILQVRPTADALYNSRLEPWSHWLTGPGSNPGYDPLAFAVAEGHRRGIEIHAWFNPFRTTVSAQPVGRGHISHTQPGLLLKAGSTTMLNPSSATARAHVLSVIMDVVRRYDIDGVHLDDYFYPYPPHHRVADGRSPAQRRAVVDEFVSKLYTSIKSAKPWVRVGISPFGIWQPGHPESVKAGVNAYEQLACDARKWLAKGWVDYLAPQLYWRCESDQSFPELMRWWSAINPRRPVWPGIASGRINSREDPGRPAAEIGRQIDYSRQLARESAGQLYWSWKSLGTNRGGVQRELAARYTGCAVPPAMPWCGTSRPGRPAVQVAQGSNGSTIRWQAADNQARKWVIQLRENGRWRTLCLLPGAQRSVLLPAAYNGRADRIAVRPISACGTSGEAGVCAK